MRRYNPAGIAPANTRRVEARKPAMRKQGPPVQQQAKTIDEINDLFRAASRGARQRSLTYLHRMELDDLAARRRLR